MSCYNDLDIKEVITVEVPDLAFKREGLLLRICCFTALHIAKAAPQDLEAINANQYYVDLALKEHRNEVVNLNASTADAVCLSSTFVRLKEIVNLQDQSIEPYVAPTQRLRIASTVVFLYKESWQWTPSNDLSVAQRAMGGLPTIRDIEPLFRVSNRSLFLLSLRRDNHPRYENERWFDDIQGGL